MGGGVSLLVDQIISLSVLLAEFSGGLNSYTGGGLPVVKTQN